ncbi:catenin delta-2-like isoform X2 [Tigriopus californicus]|nr:catenin delta-2-like isoform X2 [Tigriopus californicus]
MPQFNGQNGGNGPHVVTNGYSEQNSPNSSQLSSEGQDATLISRTQKQHTTQQVTTTTKTIREIQYLGPDGQPIEFVPSSSSGGPPPVHPRLSTSSNPSGPPPPQVYDPYSVNGPNGYGDPRFQQPEFGDYEQYGPQYGNYAEYPHRPPTPPSPSDRSASPPPDHREPDYMRHGSSGSDYPPRSGYDELDTTLMPPRQGESHLQQPTFPGIGPGGHPLPPGSAGGGGGGGGGGVRGYSPHHRHSSLDDHPHSLQGSIGGGYDPNLNNSVFEDTASIQGSTNHTGYPFGAPRAMFDDDESGQSEPPPLMKRTSRPSVNSDSSRGMAGVQWRDPDLHEVIAFLDNSNSVIKANAAAYLQHLCYMDDPVKAKTRQLGGIPPLVNLLSHDTPEIHRNACGALRNLSYGRQNDENKRAIKNAGGIPSLVRLLRKTADNEVKELVTGVLWNLSSCDDLKRTIIDESLLVLVNIVIIPHSGWDRNGPGSDTVWSTVFRNSSGILRNVSSAGDYGRRKLRECEGLVDALLYLVKKAIQKANIDNKSVENCVCVLRNLSYRAQEIEDPNYDKKQMPSSGGPGGVNGGESRAGAKPTSDNLGCFGASKAKKKEGMMGQGSGPGGSNSVTSNNSSRVTRTGPPKAMDLLWQPEVVVPYLNLLSNCSNPETLEAAAGAIQNLSACYWQPSIDIRAAVRKEKGLPILVELLRMEVDRVVCAVATALRNLAIDPRNKDLIGKYAMRDLVQKLPSGNPQHDHGTSDDTIAAVLATLNEVIKKHPEFSRSLLEAGGVERLMTITRQRSRFTSRVVKFASQVLYSMWVHQELREVYRKAGWKEQDFVTKTIAARNARPNSPTNMNSTLNRPMASQSGTRYEDRTMRRSAAGSGAGAGSGGAASGSVPVVGGNGDAHAKNSYLVEYRPEDVPMENLSLYGRTGHPQAQQPIYAPNHHVLPGEPVYAQVNRDKKKNSRNHAADLAHHQPAMHPNAYQDYGDHADHWQVANHHHHGVPLDPQQQIAAANHSGSSGQAAGDSWV